MSVSILPAILGLRNDTGIQGDGITADSSPIVFGTAAPFASVRLMHGPTQLGSATADGTGAWQALANLIGEAGVTLVARTDDGDSAGYPLVVDQTAPAPPVPGGFAGDTAGDRSLPIWQTADTTPAVTGTAEAGAIIRAYDGRTLLGTTLAGLGGGWTLDLGTLPLGQFHAIGIEAEDGAGNASAQAMLNLRVGETTIPVVTAVQGPAAANYPAGAALDFTIQFNKPVVATTLPGGAGPLLEVLVGDQLLTAGYFSSPAPHRLTFRLVLPPGASDQDGIALGRLLVTGGTIADSSDNRLSGGLAGVPDLSGVLVQADLAAPTLTGVTGPSAGNYAAGDLLVFTLAFDEPVQLQPGPGAGPQLEVLIGGTTWLAGYHGQPAANRLAFGLVVQAEAMAQDGIALGRLLPGGAAVADGAGNAWPAVLGPLPDLSGVLVQADLTAPAIAAVRLERPGPFGLGDTIVLLLQLTEPVGIHDGGAPPVLDLTLAGEPARAVLLPDSDPGLLRFGLTVAPGMPAGAITLVGLRDPGGTVADFAGHPLALDLPAAPGLAPILVDALAPGASLADPGAARIIPGETLHLVLTTTEPVHLADGLDLPGLLLDLGGAARTAAYDPARSSATSLAFTLLVQPGDVARAGIGVVGLEDPAGRLQDAAGNALAFAPPAHLLAMSLWPADQTPPAVLHVTEPVQGTAFDLILEFSEPLVLTGADPALTLLVDGTPRIASLSAAPQSTLLVFRLDLPHGAPLPQDIELGDGLTPGHVADGAGNDWDGSGLAGLGWHYALAGDTSLAGGPGDDIYYVDSMADVIFEHAGQGRDLVVASGSYYLFEAIEALTLAAGAGDLFGVGNGLANTVTGNAGANLLIGWDAADTLLGGAGDDVLYGVAAEDSLDGGRGGDYLFGGDGADTLAGGEATDILYGEAGGDRLLGGTELDYLFGGTGDDTLDGGTDADVLYGEEGADSLTGGADYVFDMLVGGDGDDTIDGRSGFGDGDYLFGQAGQDTYVVDAPGDVVFEGLGEGIDTVFADITGAGYYLYANIENLVLLGVTPFGVGNELANAMTGNAQANWLLGGAGDDTLDGGSGDDVLFGEAGADVFTLAHGCGSDAIGDFAPGTDRLRLTGPGLGDFAAVSAATTQYGDSLLIDLGEGDAIILFGIARDALRARDFLLG